MNRFALSFLIPTLLGSTLIAQCPDNMHPLTLVDSAGNPVATQPDGYGGLNWIVPSVDVFVAFDPSTPTGDYYIHVTDTLDGNDEVLSTNDPLDRFVRVTNNAGVITLSTPMGTGMTNYGIGLNGVGESLQISPLKAPSNGTCEFKVVMGDNWDLSSGPESPYILGGSTSTNCVVRSFAGFVIDDGTPSDVTGNVFNDLNQNGVQDAGEPGLAGWEVRLVDGTTSVSTTTDANGDYVFVDAGAGSFTTELTLQPGYVASTSIANAIESPGCAPVAGGGFGVYMQTSFNCEARTIGFWRNKHGKDIVTNLDLLPLLSALNIVDENGIAVSFSSFNAYKAWLKGANSVNMAYMLSAQLVAMHNNVAAGFVDGFCVTDDPQLGPISINDLMMQATMSLLADPFTPVGHPARASQEALKNALDRANNNSNWM